MSGHCPDVQLDIPLDNWMACSTTRYLSGLLKGIHSRAQFEIIKQEFTQNDIQRCKKLVEHLNDSLDLQENDGDGNSDENIHRVVAVTP